MNMRDFGDVYHDQFLDHVAALDYRVLVGARHSVALYREPFPNLRFRVDEQVARALSALPARGSRPDVAPAQRF